MATSTSAIGKPVASAAACSATSPPPSSRVMATIPSNAHQKTRWAIGASSFPPAVMVSMTSEPESEEVTKKTITNTMPMTDVRPASGSISNILNRAISGCCACTAATSPASRWCDSAVAPKAFIQSAESSTGATSMQPNERAHGTPARDAGDEHADEGRPREPPRPEEGGPPVQEIGVAAPQPVAERSDRRDIVTEAGNEPKEQVEGGPDRQDEHEQQQGQEQVGLTQALDAPVHARDHRRQCHPRSARDQQHLGRVGGRNPERMSQPCRRLLGSQPQRRRHNPKRVANTARMSMTWPNRPHTASPRTG